ncbi:hypothetical protein GCM10023186_25070 [Hymenobacter koreensis]|uniref:Uncharacterized protein n=1 Tax=Hymenobacter koreensis TaxID=1084523 RepID=A0ABP8J2Z7_9BACT
MELGARVCLKAAYAGDSIRKSGVTKTLAGLGRRKACYNGLGDFEFEGGVEVFHGIDRSRRVFCGDALLETNVL